MELSSISTGYTLEVHIYNSFSVSLCALYAVMELQETLIKEAFFMNEFILSDIQDDYLYISQTVFSFKK